MKAYYANPNYSDASNSPYWTVIGAKDPAQSLSDLTKLSVGTIIAPTDGGLGYYALHVEDLSRLMKGWSYLSKMSRGVNCLTIQPLQATRVTFPLGDPFIYVNDISGFDHYDILAILEGLKSGYDPYSTSAITSDNGHSQWSYVRNAGTIPTVSPKPSSSFVSFSLPVSYLDTLATSDASLGTTDITSHLNVAKGIDYGTISSSANCGTGSIVANGTTWTITTLTALSLVVGQQVTLSGFFPTGYNGTFTVASITSTTVFTVSNTTTGVGTVTTGGNVSGIYCPTVPSPTNIGNNTVGNWYVTSSGDNTALNNLLTLLPDFTFGGQSITSVVVGSSSTVINLSSANSAFTVGQTVTVVTNGASVSQLGAPAPMGWYAGQITSIAGSALTTNLTYATSVSMNPLAGSLNTAVVFDGTVTSLTTITLNTFSSSSNFGLAIGQTLSLSSVVSTGTKILSIANEGVGATITVDTNLLVSSGTYTSFSAIYSDSNPMAYASTLTNEAIRLNHNGNQFDCSYFTSPYYTMPSGLYLNTALTAGTSYSSISVTNQTNANIVLSSSTMNILMVINGDDYVEVILSGTQTAYANSTATLSLYPSFTPTVDFPVGSSVYTSSDKNHSRYGRNLILPVTPTHYRNLPVAKFKSMIELTGFTETTANGTYQWGTVGGTYYSESPYTVFVDSVANIFVGQKLTFRNSYTPWWSETYDDTSPADPWTWSISNSVTTTAGSATLGLTVTTDGLNLRVGQYIFTGANGTSGKYVVSWTSSTITLNSGTGITSQATPFSITLTPGRSNMNEWKVYSVDTTANSFVIYASNQVHNFSGSAYPNGDGQNNIFEYNPQMYIGNTFDSTTTQHQGAGVIGLMSGSDSSKLDSDWTSDATTWHDPNTVVGSYIAGARYVGSQSIGDQETISPSCLGSLVGTTLSTDITARFSDHFTTNSIPNTAQKGDWSYGDINNYGTTTRFNSDASWAGFANIATSDTYEGTSGNYSTQQQVPIVIGQGDTQEMVLINVPNYVSSAASIAEGTPVDGSNSTNAPMIWYLASGQAFQYNHIAGEPVCTPNFVYNTVGSINHAKNTPVLGAPDTGVVYG